MYSEQLEPGAHHERVRFADVVCLLAGRKLDGSQKRAAGGSDTVLGGTRQVVVRADELCAVVDETYRLGYHLKAVASVLADDHIVGVHVVVGDAHVIECVLNAVLAHYECRASGRLTVQKLRCRKRTGVEVRFVNVKSESAQLLLKLTRRILPRVGQKKKFLVVFLQPTEKFLHAGQKTVAVIDNAVHVADKALFLKKPVQYYLLFHLHIVLF